MRAVVQRVKRGGVLVNGCPLAEIQQGLVVLLGVAKDDSQADVNYMVDKIANLRIFADQTNKPNLSVKEIEGEVLLVSQFTLLADVRRGRRPSYSDALASDEAKPIYKQVTEGLRKNGLEVKQGQFGEMMQVELVNDGPVTVLLDSKKTF